MFGNETETAYEYLYVVYKNGEEVARYSDIKKKFLLKGVSL